MGMIYRVEKKTVVLLSFLYIYIPIFLFLFGWINTYIAIVCSAIILAVTKKCYKRVFKDSNEKKEFVTLEAICLLIVIIFFFAIGYYAGYGRFVLQAGDWYKHNAVLNDLVSREWPVIYKNESEESMLTYYIGQYLVPACIGKIFGSYRLAEIALYIWNIIGLILVYIHILFFLQVNQKRQLMVPIFLVFFCTPLLLGQFILKLVTGYDYVWNLQWYFLDKGNIMIQYSSNYVLLRWVFPQVIVTWLVMMLLLEFKEYIEYYILIILPVLFFATLSFLGMIPIGLCVALQYLYNTHSLKNWIRKVFSIENWSLIFSLGGVLGLYFGGNIFSEKPENIGVSGMPYNGEWMIYLIFVITNVLLYAIILWKKNKYNLVYYGSIVVLCLLPLVKMGLWNDLGMRASIPALFVLYLLTMEYLFDKKNRTLIGKSVCIGLILIGMIYPVKELYNSVINEDYCTLGNEVVWNSLEQFANRKSEIADDLKYNYYTYDYRNSLFYTIISKE